MLTRFSLHRSLAPSPSDYYVQGVPVSPSEAVLSRLGLPYLHKLSLKDELYVIVVAPALNYFEGRTMDLLGSPWCRDETSGKLAIYAGRIL